MFDPARYGSVFQPLLAEERLNPLGPGTPNESVYPLLKALSVDEAFLPHEVKDASMAKCCLAGIWLYHDFLDESHRISQSVSTSTGSYWHGIMHRREPDSWNSKYWFNRVGQHPVFPDLCEAAKSLAEQASLLPETRFLVEQRQWDPHRFVDLCEASRTGKSQAERLCRTIQLKEWQLLFDYCYRRAIGS
ncbi:hypothetical protein [Methylocaldum szegediense]|jgi:hypothetical protein|uniref:Uncharacterized protein n=1 Tax=Methylocaldum szegediense TaxID=73780 RepID=A0ABN8X501_9GAMM|nr:hypothetical protein [Methylocaldum szegediense]CAI8822170.1 conserved protein of unknown function [Methylocaldum szegediense]